MGCGSACGNLVWSADERRRWSDDHAAGLLDLPRVLPPPIPFSGLRLIRAEVDDPVELAIGGRPAREYGAWLEGRWRGPERSVAVPAANTSALANVDCLHLGESARWGSLVAVLPRGYRPVVPAGLMWPNLLPEHDHPSLPWRLAAGDARVLGVGSERPGLFWKGPRGPHAAAWGFAASGATDGGRARPVVLGPMPARYRDRVGPDRAEIRVSSLGQVSLVRATPLMSWTGPGRHHALEQTAGVAAMADYYLWWARRLYSYHCTDSKSPWDLMLAREAARAGLRWIGRLAGELRHLDGHDAMSREQEVGHV